MASHKPDKTSVKDWLSSKLDGELSSEAGAAEPPASPDGEEEPRAEAGPAVEPATAPVGPATEAAKPAPATVEPATVGPPEPPRPRAPIRRQAPLRRQAPRRAPVDSRDARAQITDPKGAPAPALPASLEIDEADPPTEQLAVREGRRTSPSAPLPVQAGPSVSEGDGDRKTRPLPAPEDGERTSTRGRPGVPSYTGGQEPGRLSGAIPPRPQARQGTRPRIVAPSPGGAVPRMAPLVGARPSTPIWALDDEEDDEDAPTVFTVSTATPLSGDDRTHRSLPVDSIDADLRGDTVSGRGTPTRPASGAAAGPGIAAPSSPEPTPLVPLRRPDVPSGAPAEESAAHDEDIHDAPTVAAAQIPDMSISSASSARPGREVPPLESPDPTRAPPAMLAWMALGAVLLIVMAVVGLSAAVIVGLVGP